MGCDIHTRAEVLTPRRKYDSAQQKAVDLDPIWKMVKDQVFDDPYFSPNQQISRYNMPHTNEPYNGRNYQLFAKLADVRNGSGFAGVETHRPIEPIAEPRGVPEDASKGWRKYVDGWGSDLHSASYFTLTELLAVDWHGTIEIIGDLTEAQYLALRHDDKKPQSWVHRIFPGDDVVSDEDYEAGKRGPASGFMVRTRWEDDVYDSFAIFVENTIPALERLAPFIGEHPGYDAIRANNGVDPRPRNTDAVRLVFGFDN